MNILSRHRQQLTVLKGSTTKEAVRIKSPLPSRPVSSTAWVAWVERNLIEAHKYGRIALELWQQVPPGHASCAFQWTALWPLLGVALTQSEIAAAIEYAQALLDPKQKRLPDALTTVLNNAIQAWDAGDEESALSQLTHAIELAQELRHF